MSKHDIAESIRKLAGSTNAFETFVCEVKSVDGATCTVTRVLDGLEIADVRLNCHITENEGIVVTPKINSFVLVTNIDGRQHFVSQCSKVEKITINCDTKIVINDGKNDGIIKIKELTEKLNAFVDTFNNHTHSGTFTGTIGGAAAEGELTLINTTEAASFNRDYYEDGNITH